MDTSNIRVPLGLDVVGIDEVGRGSLAGPVVCAAAQFKCMLPEDFILALDDSKKLSQKKRAALIPAILSYCDVAVALFEPEEIDAMGIGVAIDKAMKMAMDRLPRPARLILVDGKHIPVDLRGRAQALVKGDATEPVIAAASVYAKEYRDDLMRGQAVSFPGYGWEKNVGYGSVAHCAAILERGATPKHRRTFIAKILARSQTAQRG